jgi:phosphatidate cytidylyltransferase
VLLAIVAVFYLLGTAAFFALICLVVLVALFEALDALVVSGRRPAVALGLVGGFGLLLAAYSRSAGAVMLSVGATTYLVLAWSLRPGRARTAASDAAWTLSTVLWIAGGGAAAVGVMLLGREGLALLVSFLLVAALDDVLAYFAGTIFGRHKLAPSISPGKSWEGLAAGFAFACAGGALAGLVVPPLTPLTGLGLGAVVGFAAPVGDLVESLFKRELGIKDSGRLLPGHGGVLDRVDAIVFSAPAAFLYLHFIL